MDLFYKRGKPLKVELSGAFINNLHCIDYSFLASLNASEVMLSYQLRAY